MSSNKPLNIPNTRKSSFAVPVSQSLPNSVGRRRSQQVTFSKAIDGNNGQTNTPSMANIAVSRRGSNSKVVKFAVKSMPICITPKRLIPWPHLDFLIADANLVKGFSIVEECTIGLLEAFRKIEPAYAYDRSHNPRRVLTKPSRPTHNQGADNEKWDLILQVGDILGEDESCRYIILDLLGHGTFGQVVKARNIRTSQLAAVKVIKNQTSYFNQSMMEVTVLEMLNNRFDPSDRHHIVRLKDTFVFRNHLCIVVELLGANLYELVKQNGYRGFSLGLCRVILAQCLDALQIMRAARIIHCDLKPENILLQAPDSPAIKIIDFGSACHEHQTVYTYIQSRFYRSPEVILGLPYSSSIDMWSLGCIAAELFLGLPVFPGASNYDQIARIVETLGMPPKHMLDVGKDASTYFARNNINGQWTLKNREQYSRDTGRQEGPSKKYFSSSDLTQIVMTYTHRSSSTASSSFSRQGMIDEEARNSDMAQRRCFLDFVRGLLCINPLERWSPVQALQHPFITGKSFTGTFTPGPIQFSNALGISKNITSAPINRAHYEEGSALEPNMKHGQRQRSYTLATLHLHDVPPELQRLAAAVEETGEHLPPANPKLPSEEFSIDPQTGTPLKSRRGSSLVVPAIQTVEKAADASMDLLDSTFMFESQQSTSPQTFHSSTFQSRRQSIPNHSLFSSSSATNTMNTNNNPTHHGANNTTIGGGSNSPNISTSSRRSSMSSLTNQHMSASPLHQVFSTTDSSQQLTHQDQQQQQQQYHVDFLMKPVKDTPSNDQELYQEQNLQNTKQ